MTLQHFALKYIVSKYKNIKVIVGCSEKKHALEALDAVNDTTEI